MQDRPARSDRERLQPGVGVDRTGVADGLQQRGVVDRVGVGEGLVEVDVVVLRPLAHGSALALRPHEVSVVAPGEAAVLADLVASRDDGVDAEALGERSHEVLRGGRREHDQPAGLLVLGDEHLGEGPDHRLEHVGREHGRLVEGVGGPALGDEDRLAGQGDRAEGLTEEVEVAEEEGLAGHPCGDDPGLPHGGRQRRPGGLRQEGPVQIEECCARHAVRLPTRSPAGQGYGV